MIFLFFSSALGSKQQIGASELKGLAVFFTAYYVCDITAATCVTAMTAVDRYYFALIVRSSVRCRVSHKTHTRYTRSLGFFCIVQRCVSAVIQVAL